MIAAAILWAIGATCLGIAAGLIALTAQSRAAWAEEQRRRAAAHAEWSSSKAADLEYRLREIERKRHNAAVKARAAQLAANRAKVVSTAAQIQRELGR